MCDRGPPTRDGAGGRVRAEGAGGYRTVAARGDPPREVEGGCRVRPLAHPRRVPEARPGDKAISGHLGSSRVISGNPMSSRRQGAAWCGSGGRGWGSVGMGAAGGSRGSGREQRAPQLQLPRVEKDRDAADGQRVDDGGTAERVAGRLEAKGGGGVGGAGGPQELGGRVAYGRGAAPGGGAARAAKERAARCRSEARLGRALARSRRSGWAGRARTPSSGGRPARGARRVIDEGGDGVEAGTCRGGWPPHASGRVVDVSWTSDGTRGKGTDTPHRAPSGAARASPSTCCSCRRASALPPSSRQPPDASACAPRARLRARGRRTASRSSRCQPSCSGPATAWTAGAGAAIPPAAGVATRGSATRATRRAGRRGRRCPAQPRRVSSQDRFAPTAHTSRAAAPRRRRRSLRRTCWCTPRAKPARVSLEPGRWCGACFATTRALRGGCAPRPARQNASPSSRQTTRAPTCTQSGRGRSARCHSSARRGRWESRGHGLIPPTCFAGTADALSSRWGWTVFQAHSGVVYNGSVNQGPPELVLQTSALRTYILPVRTFSLSLSLPVS